MLRITACVLAVGMALATGPLLAAPAQADAALAPATELQQYAAQGGLGLTWTASTNTVTGYHVYRGAELLVEVPATATALTALDTSVPAGGSASYTVVAYSAGGEAPPTAALTATRAATEATVGTTNALVVQGIYPQQVALDAARPGDRVGFSAGALRATRRDRPGGTLTLPVVPGPGSYVITATPTGAQRRLTFANMDAQCPGIVGTLLVRQASFDASLTPLTYAAELTGDCFGYPVTASVRLANDTPYVAATLTADPAAPQTDPGVLLASDVLVTNQGLAPLAIGASTLVGADAADYTVARGTCPTELAPAGTCSLSIGFTPTAYGPRPAQLDQTLGTLGEVHPVALAGIGGHLPGLIQNPRVTTGYGRKLVSWDPPVDRGSPTGLTYHVVGGYNGDTSRINVTTSATSFLDTGLSADPVSGTTYRITASNTAGTGPFYDTNPVHNADAAVLEVSEGPGGVPGLFQVPIGYQPERRIPFLVDDRPRYTPTVSPDGGTVVYAEESATGNIDLWSVSSSGLGGSTRLTSLVGDETEPTWSRDGTTIAFTYVSAAGVSVQTLPAGGGTPTQRAAGYSHPSWLADNTRLIADKVGENGLYVLDAAGHAALISGSTGGSSPSVSPDGTLIAYLQDDTVTHVAVLPVAGGTPVVLDDDADWDSVSWGPAGGLIYGERHVGTAPGALSWTAYFAGSGGYGPGFNAPNTTLTEPGASDATPVILGNKVHLTSAPAVTGSSATVSFAGGTPVQAGTAVTCSLDGAAQASSYCTSPVTLSGLATGVHRLVISSHPSNSSRVDSVTALEWTVDATAPAVRVLTPAAHTVSTATTAGISYTATDTGAGVASYDVRYRTATNIANYGAYTSPAGWSGTTATSRSVPASPGYEYCFSVRARDTLGNASDWSADRCVDVALDDAAFTAGPGWSRGKAGGYYRGTFSSSSKTGAALSLRSVQTRRITLVVTKCPTCGQVGLYVGGTRVAVVDTRAAKTTLAATVTVVLPALRSGAFTLKPLQAGRLVRVDGVSFGRV